MIINHHIAAMLASERQRDMVDGGNRWRLAKRPAPSTAVADLPAPLPPQRETPPHPQGTDGRLRIVRARRLAASRHGDIRSRARH